MKYIILIFLLAIVSCNDAEDDEIYINDFPHRDAFQYSLSVFVWDIFLPATKSIQISNTCNRMYINLMVLIMVWIVLIF